MAHTHQHGGGCGGRLCGSDCKEMIVAGVLRDNPVTCQVLGICSCLAVTSRLANALVMGGALLFVLIMSNIIVSLLRSLIPRRIRMIAEVAVIATFVIFFDQFLKAYYWEMSKQLGPYVGLIITNCIVMGRAEALAMHKPPLHALVDGVGNGLGFGAVLAMIAAIRELVGFGTLLNLPVLAEAWYPRNVLFVLAPGAFFTAGFLIWIMNAIRPAKEAQQ